MNFKIVSSPIVAMPVGRVISLKEAAEYFEQNVEHLAERSKFASSFLLQGFELEVIPDSAYNREEA